MKYLNAFRFGLGLVCLLSAGISQAAIFKIDFSAKNFTSSYWGTTPPQDPIFGSITFQADTFGANIDAITGVSLIIDGHDYQANEIGGNPVGNGYFFGGLLNDTNSIGWGTNDFWINAFTSFNNNSSFSYASTSAFDGWTTLDIDYNFSKVPEPTSLSLFLAGLILLVSLKGTKRHKITKS